MGIININTYRIFVLTYFQKITAALEKQQVFFQEFQMTSLHLPIFQDPTEMLPELASDIRIPPCQYTWEMTGPSFSTANLVTKLTK